MAKFDEDVREVAPASLRAKAGFAKTHARPMIPEFPDDDQETGPEETGTQETPAE